MAGDPPDSGRFFRRLLGTAEWSVAEKCALVLGIYLAFDLWAFAAGTFLALHPERAHYLDPAVLPLELLALGTQIAVTVAVLVWALAIRHRPMRRVRPVLYATAVICASDILQGAYAYGTQTRLSTAAAICGSVAIATVLFERSVVRVWVVTVMAGLTFLTIGEVGGLFRYGPLLKRLPFGAEQLAPSWMLGTGGISLAILYVAVGLTYAIVRSWHERGARLVAAARRMAFAEQVAAVIDTIDDGIVVLDTTRRMVAANAAFLRRVGTSREAIAGRFCETLVAGLGCAAQCPTLRCVESGERRAQVFPRSEPGGETVWEEVRSSPIPDESGAVRQVVEVWRDISHRRRAEVKLAEAHRLASLGMLASGFSHEINAPLATVLACVEDILRRTEAGPSSVASDGPERVRLSASIAREQLLRCSDTTRHFLRLASDSGAQSELVDVDAAVEQVARLAAPTANAAGVKLVVERRTGGARVRGNTADLEHVLLNLVLNAIQVSAAGTSVRLVCDGTDPVSIRVQDEGPGIAAADQARIFEPFCSLRPGGTGLGLFLALDFARRWGADIRLDSSPDAGATFEVIWPAISATEPAGKSA